MFGNLGKFIFYIYCTSGNFRLLKISDFGIFYEFIL